MQEDFNFRNVHNSHHPNFGSNIRGEFGESILKALFVKMGYRVCDVQGDWYPYDMVVERRGEIYRVQVKTSDSKSCQRPYPSSEFSKSLEFDIAAIMTVDGSIYIIPERDMTYENRRDSMRFKLYPKHEKYKVAKFGGFEMFGESLPDRMGEV